MRAYKNYANYVIKKKYVYLKMKAYNLKFLKLVHSKITMIAVQQQTSHTSNTITIKIKHF